ncbi:uncharacterized protein [Apostichopus japonicus]|uniref:uncharacterized protein isoform X2 n=1 Tax=Stichopus japonicus TaxID=307972 RepID=UPI003AB127EE
MGNNQSFTAISNVSRRATGTSGCENRQATHSLVAGSQKGSDEESDYLDCTEGAIASKEEHEIGNEEGKEGRSGLLNKVLLADDSSSSDNETDSHLSALDRLLIKQRRERMLELQSIQERTKRVSDGKNLKRLERFFTQAQRAGDYQSETESVSSDQSENSTTSGEQRSVVLEVRGLFQSQPVTSVLESHNFRSQLENIIRGNVVRQERELETALRLRNAGLPGNTVSGRPLTDGFVPANLHEEASTISSSTHSSVNIHPSSSNVAASQHHGHPMPTPPPPAPPGIVNQFMPIPMAYPQPYHAGPNQHFGHLPHPSYFMPPQPRQPYVQQPSPQVSGGGQGPSSGGVAPSQSAWLLNRAGNDNNGNGSVEDIQQIHRENIITEISNLVHSQLVTSTLESNFRGQLEVMLQDHAAGQDGDRQQVMEFVQNLPRRNNIVRNDFSHLGINPSGAAGGGSTQEINMNSHTLTHEMTTLRNQMVELQNMVKVSFDLQLDLQRSIRQEVAAALHNSPGGNLENAVAAPPNRDVHPAEEGHCIICLDKSIDSVLYQCGHMCVCLTCGLRLKDIGSHCPMCRAPIRDVIRAYKCHEK